MDRFHGETAYISGELCLRQPAGRKAPSPKALHKLPVFGLWSKLQAG